MEDKYEQSKLVTNNTAMGATCYCCDKKATRFTPFNRGGMAVCDEHGTEDVHAKFDPIIQKYKDEGFYLNEGPRD